MNSPFPFLNLRAQHDTLRAELLGAFGRVLDASAFAGGPFVANFERDFAAYCGTRQCIGVGSGTDALWLTLLALGVGAGDEVITVPATFLATAEAISHCGARPVFVDIDEQFYTMVPRGLERAITPRTKAIIPVHLYGQMADMDPIMAIARRHALPVIEDACQAHGARYRGRRAGSIGVAGCFSFYPGKNLGALGEAGAVVTGDADLAAKIAVLRDHGQQVKYRHSCVGWNGRMDGIQGAVLQIKLRDLDRRNAARRKLAERYSLRLSRHEQVIVPPTATYGEPVHHLYAIRLKHRDAMLRTLAQRGIECGIHYPIPVHLQPAYASLGYGPGAFPVAERCANEVLSLPMFPEMTETDVDAIASELEHCLAAARPNPIAPESRCTAA